MHSAAMVAAAAHPVQEGDDGFDSDDGDGKAGGFATVRCTYNDVAGAKLMGGTPDAAWGFTLVRMPFRTLSQPADATADTPTMVLDGMPKVAPAGLDHLVQLYQASCAKPLACGCERTLDSRQPHPSAPLHPLWESWTAASPPQTASAAASTGGVVGGGSASATAPTGVASPPFYWNPTTGATCTSFPRTPPPLRGGILADEMGASKPSSAVAQLQSLTLPLLCLHVHPPGLGKTLEMIGLVLSHPHSPPLLHPRASFATYPHEALTTAAKSLPRVYSSWHPTRVHPSSPPHQPLFPTGVCG